jgi:putative ABC transport system permease protein
MRAVATSEADPSGVGHQPGPARRRRLRVLEALVIVLAIASAALVRERGVPAAQDRLLGIDPLVAGAPVLMGFAVAIVTWHAARVGLRALAAAARRRPGLVPVLAFRRSTRGTGSGMILAVLLTAAAIAAFSLAGAGQITASTRAAAWQAVGADYLVEGADGRPLAASAATTPSSPEPAASGSVAAVPLEAVFPDATVVSAGYRDSVPIGPVGDQADLLALDPAYQRLVAGTPIESSLPPGVLDSAAGSSTDPLPGIVSSSLTIAQEPVAAGDTVVLSAGARRVPVHVIAVRETFPSLPEGDPFVVVSLPGLEQAVSSPLARSRIYLRAPGAAAPALRREIAAAFPDGLIRDRASLQAALDGAPLPRAVSTGLTLAAVAAIAYAALAVVAALTLAGASRGVEAAHLRALGMSRRQQVQVVLLEYLPIVALAFAVGIAAGFAFFVAVQPGLHVASLAGTMVESPPAVDAGQTLGLLFGLTITAIAAILAGTLVEQRTSPASTARRSLE